MLAGANADSCVVPQNKISHPVRRYGRLMQVPVLSAHTEKEKKKGGGRVAPYMSYCA